MRLKKNLLFGTFCSVLSVIFTLTVPAHSQAKVQPVLTGYTGNIEVLPNIDLRQTTIVFTSPIVLNAASNQIVFVLLGTDNHSSWSGNGRILVGDGVLAVLEKNDTSVGDGLLFKFAEKSNPAALEKVTLRAERMIGVARYGENRPLTEGQIESLANTGRFARSGDSLSHSAFSDSIHLRFLPVQDAGCSSGGQGSTSCGAGGGGCTVTCGIGFSACCNATTNNCTCKVVPVLPAS